MTNGPTMHTDRLPPTSGYGNTNPDIYTNEVKPPTMFSSTPMYGGDVKPEYNYPYPPQYHDKYNYYQDIYPIYPMLYNGDSKYPGMNTFPMNGYAANVPTIGSPQPSVNYYGNTMTTTTTAMNSGRPSVSPHGSETVGGTTYMGNGWSNAEELNRHKPNGEKPTPSMSNANEYGGNTGSGSTTKYPEGNYNNNETPSRTTIPYIQTYFNPDDFLYNPNIKRE